jgi:hypothetical protein
MPLTEPVERMRFYEVMLVVAGTSTPATIHIHPVSSSVEGVRWSGEVKVPEGTSLAIGETYWFRSEKLTPGGIKVAETTPDPTCFCYQGVGGQPVVIH